MAFWENDIFRVARWGEWRQLLQATGNPSGDSYYPAPSCPAVLAGVCWHGSLEWLLKIQVLPLPMYRYQILTLYTFNSDNFFCHFTSIKLKRTIWLLGVWPQNLTSGWAPQRIQGVSSLLIGVGAMALPGDRHRDQERLAAFWGLWGEVCRERQLPLPLEFSGPLVISEQTLLRSPGRPPPPFSHSEELSALTERQGTAPLSCPQMAGRKGPG